MRRSWWRALRSFWEHDPGLSAILLLLVLLVFVLPPFSAPREQPGPLADLAFSLLLFAGVAGLRAHTLVRGFLFLAALVATLVRLDPSPADHALALANLVSLALLTSVVLTQAFRAGPVTIHRIQGAVAAYLLLGLAWASAYELVDALAGEAFAGAVQPGARSWIYFSFVTLTTVGYGDITPLHPAARSLAILEALVGQLYPAILLARLVSLQTQLRG